MNYLFKLKLLNGPLAGRELGLPEGELRLGGDDPDLALPLEEAASATLTVSEDGVRLISATPVWVNGERWENDPLLPLGMVIDLAGQALILGKEPAELASQPIPQRRSPPTSRKLLYLAGSIIVIIVCSLIGVGITIWQPTEPAPPLSIEHWLANQLQHPELKGITFHKNNAGTIILNGHCASSLTLNTLRARLREQGEAVQDKTTCQDILLRNVRYVLELNGYRDVDVKTGNVLGDVEIRGGTIQADIQWRQTAKQLDALPGLSNWTVINDDNPAFRQLVDRLRDKELLEGISITLVNSTLHVSGQLNATRAKAVTAVLATFNQQEASGRKAIFHNIPPAEPANDVLPAAVASLGGNPHGLYVELANGMRLQQGSMLPSGYTIYSLSQHGLALLKNETLIYLPLNL